MELLWMLKKYQVEIPGVNWKKNWNFQDWSKKYYVKFPYSKSSYLGLKFPRGVTQFHEICKDKAFFYPEFQKLKW